MVNRLSILPTRGAGSSAPGAPYPLEKMLARLEVTFHGIDFGPNSTTTEAVNAEWRQKFQDTLLADEALGDVQLAELRAALPETAGTPRAQPGLLLLHDNADNCRRQEPKGLLRHVEIKAGVCQRRT